MTINLVMQPAVRSSSSERSRSGLHEAGDATQDGSNKLCPVASRRLIRTKASYHFAIQSPSGLPLLILGLSEAAGHEFAT